MFADIHDETKGAYPPVPRSALGEWLRDRDWLERWTATEGGCVVGHVGLASATGDTSIETWRNELRLDESQLGVIAKLAVSDSHRNKGLGRALMTCAIEEARRLGRTPVLDVFAENAAAIDLYMDMGFVTLDVSDHEGRPLAIMAVRSSPQ